MSLYFGRASLDEAGRCSWPGLYGLIVRGLKVYAFYLLVLSFFRLSFVIGLHDYWAPGTGAADVLVTLWRGFRLSFQTAGALALAALLPAALLHFVGPRVERWAWRIVTGLTLAVLSVLFVASFPYYRQFRANFNQMLFTGAQDDKYALFMTMMQQYYLPVRLAAALLLAYVLWRILRAWLAWRPFERWLYRQHLSAVARWLGRGLAALGVYIAVLLGIFGGSLGWQTAVNWENAGVMRDDFLNEAILDSPQAIYRAYELNSRMLACNGLDFTVDDIRRLAAQRAGMPPDSDDLDVYLTHEAQGSRIAQSQGQPPRHIFLIISESLANWPLLDKYADIPIADGLRGIIKEPDTAYCPTFLPNGASTVSAVTGVVTGFADANLYLTTMPEAYKAPYPTASAPQLAKLGYETNFWYAGPSTWERIGAFTQAQGFEHFYSRGDYGDVPGSVWGCEDEYLYQAILDRLAAEDAAAGESEQASFNVILNASNHSPYDVDIAAKGFDFDSVRAALPPEAQNDEELLKELGHYWYAARELTKFVKELKDRYPDCIVMIVGDHGDRYNIDKTPNMYERYGVPFIITGRGVTPDVLPAESAGSQIDIVPTLIELVAPAGFRYESVGRSLTLGNNRGVNYGFWITRHSIGRADLIPLEPEDLTGTPQAPFAPEVEQSMQDYIDAVRSVSWWRPKYGAKLDPELVKDR